MKKYETPSVELVKFQYNDQVVATSGCYWSGTFTKEHDGCYSKPVDGSGSWNK